MKRRRWTANEVELMQQLYPHKRSTFVAERLGRPLPQVYGAARRFGIEKSQEFIAEERLRANARLAEAGRAHRFLPGSVPVSKGVRTPGLAYGRMRETQFRKGAKPVNWCPVGTVRMLADGYLRVKIREQIAGEPTGAGNNKVWPMLHVHEWTKVHGPVPAGYALLFKDGDHMNTNLDNLELLSRAELMKRNSLHNLPSEIVEVIQLRGVVNRVINRRQREEQTR